MGLEIVISDFAKKNQLENNQQEKLLMEVVKQQKEHICHLLIWSGQNVNLCLI